MNKGTTPSCFAYSSATGGVPDGMTLPAVLRWFPSDTEKRFNENLNIPKNKAILQANGWVKRNSEEPTEILYRINEYGFRGDSIDVKELEDNCALFFGCSNVFGVGQFEKNTIPEQFKNLCPELGVVNFGQPGGSLDACTRVAMHWVPILKPKLICLLLPPGVRREFWIGDHFDDNGTDIGNRWAQYGIRRSLDRNHEIIQATFSTPQEEMVNRQRNLWAFSGLALHLGARLVVYTPEDVPRDATKQVARDCGHFGADFYEYIAKHFYKMYTHKDEVSYIPK